MCLPIRIYLIHNSKKYSILIYYSFNTKFCITYNRRVPLPHPPRILFRSGRVSESSGTLLCLYLTRIDIQLLHFVCQFYMSVIINNISGLYVRRATLPNHQSCHTFRRSISIFYSSAAVRRQQTSFLLYYYLLVRLDPLLISPVAGVACTVIW